MKGKYYLNTVTGALHIEGKCRVSKNKPYNIRYFKTHDEATIFAQHHLKECKWCFKEK